MNTQLLDQARKLDISEQIDLVEAIWDGIANHDKVPPLTAAQKADVAVARSEEDRKALKEQKRAEAAERPEPGAEASAGQTMAAAGKASRKRKPK